MIKSALAASLACAALFAHAPCVATTIVDPANDLIASYLGEVGPDLDILEFTLRFDGLNFLLDATLNGAPGTTALSRYNIGVDRGAGTNRFGEDFRAGTSFDTTINLVPNGPTGEVRLFGATDVVTPLAAGAITISGNSISVIVPLSMLPSSGFTPENYTFLLWSRTNIGSLGPSVLGIADFAPDMGTITAVPEPASWGMMLFGFGVIGAAMRRRRSAISARRGCIPQ